MVGTVVKAKVDELEAELRGLFSGFLSKESTGVVQLISGKKRSLVRFQYGC